PGLGHELPPEADQAARRHQELEAHVGAAALEGRTGDHVLHLPLALAEVLDYWAGVVLRHVDDHVLDRLGKDVGDALEDDLGPRDLELETLAPHGLNEDRKMELAAAADLELVGRLRQLDAEANIGAELARQALVEVAG